MLVNTVYGKSNPNLTLSGTPIGICSVNTITPVTESFDSENDIQTKDYDLLAIDSNEESSFYEIIEY